MTLETIINRLIREQDPLKQGLKQFYVKNVMPEFLKGEIREQDPLKQGLKLLD